MKALFEGAFAMTPLPAADSAMKPLAEADSAMRLLVEADFAPQALNIGVDPLTTKRAESKDTVPDPLAEDRYASNANVPFHPPSMRTGAAKEHAGSRVNHGNDAERVQTDDSELLPEVILRRDAVVILLVGGRGGSNAAATLLPAEGEKRGDTGAAERKPLTGGDGGDERTAEEGEIAASTLAGSGQTVMTCAVAGLALEALARPEEQPALIVMPIELDQRERGKLPGL